MCCIFSVHRGHGAMMALTDIHHNSLSTLAILLPSREVRNVKTGVCLPGLCLSIYIKRESERAGGGGDHMILLLSLAHRSHYLPGSICHWIAESTQSMFGSMEDNCTYWTRML